MSGWNTYKGCVREGDKFTISIIGQNASGDMIRRLKNDNKEPPFWGLNMRTKKRGKAIRLMVFTASENKNNSLAISPAIITKEG